MPRRQFFTTLGAAWARPRPARALIWIRLDGGLSHLDSFDPKPEAPREIRGPFRDLPTSVPGLRFCEHLPRLARQAHRLTILRSMCSTDTNHERAAARLGIAHAVAGAAPIGAGIEGAVSLTARSLGAACRAARRAVEAAARLVVVERGRPGYDTHEDAFALLAENLLPELDHALAALIEDLARSGLLEQTLVVAAGEFGRTPRINRKGGRDHHAAAWSVVLAGGGLTGGRVLGATDRWGAEVRDLAVRPEDLVRTALAGIGVDPPADHPAARGRVVGEIFRA